MINFTFKPRWHAVIVWMLCTSCDFINLKDNEWIKKRTKVSRWMNQSVTEKWSHNCLQKSLHVSSRICFRSKSSPFCIVAETERGVQWPSFVLWEKENWDLLFLPLTHIPPVLKLNDGINTAWKLCDILICVSLWWWTAVQLLKAKDAYLSH